MGMHVPQVNSLAWIVMEETDSDQVPGVMFNQK